MSTQILVKDIINTEYAVASEDGVKIFNKLNELIRRDLVPIIVDFAGISRTTTAFFNSSIAIFLKDFTPDDLNKFFVFKNLSRTSTVLLVNSIEIAKFRFNEDSDLNKVIKEELKGE